MSCPSFFLSTYFLQFVSQLITFTNYIFCSIFFISFYFLSVLFLFYFMLIFLLLLSFFVSLFAEEKGLFDYDFHSHNSILIDVSWAPSLRYKSYFQSLFFIIILLFYSVLILFYILSSTFFFCYEHETIN